MHCTHAHTVTCGSSLVCVRVISIHGHRHAHLFLSVVFFLVSLYFVLKSYFHLFLNPAMVPDENSMEDPLCNSSFGSMVSSGLCHTRHITRTTHTNLGVKQEKRIDDYWNIDGSRDLSDPWRGFTQFTLLDEKALTDILCPGGD